MCFLQRGLWHSLRHVRPTDRQLRITCKALVLAHQLTFVLYQPHAIEVMELYEGEGTEGLRCRLHSDYIVNRESPFGHLCSMVFDGNRTRCHRLWFPVNGVRFSCTRQSVTLYLSLSLLSRTQHMVTLQLVAAVQLSVSSVDICIDLSQLKSRYCGLIWQHKSFHYNFSSITLYRRNVEQCDFSNIDFNKRNFRGKVCQQKIKTLQVPRFVRLLFLFVIWKIK